MVTQYALNHITILEKHYETASFIILAELIPYKLVMTPLSIQKPTHFSSRAMSLAPTPKAQSRKISTQPGFKPGSHRVKTRVQRTRQPTVSACWVMYLTFYKWSIVTTKYIISFTLINTYLQYLPILNNLFDMKYKLSVRNTR